jgi:hypothetical protein
MPMVHPHRGGNGVPPLAAHAQSRDGSATIEPVRHRGNQTRDAPYAYSPIPRNSHQHSGQISAPRSETRTGSAN